ncbi:hypothetical protein [Jeotgalibacillus sp. R-1-5s-1]|uniref:hypothetical protein n=1 Tax=Jeotgalibacillus sp. R-1-5s-1 TaxID=2555897 RepID=UPI00106AFF09|nr:hypothetical protein [Jeotgalibacillus sp. R-1-5s-1]TFE03340.1 hypothetical protein E2491_00700 [Jeotgalibacillus sp. R-1-5s-1]
MIRIQPAMIAINIIFAVAFIIWSIQRYSENDLTMAAMLGIIGLINGFIAVKRYRIARMHDQGSK